MALASVGTKLAGIVQTSTLQIYLNPDLRQLGLLQFLVSLDQKLPIMQGWTVFGMKMTNTFELKNLGFLLLVLQW